MAKKPASKGPQVVSQTLKEWRTANRYTRPAFLNLLGKEGVKVSLRSLVYWEEKVFRPRDKHVVEAIRRVTGGEVKPESFLRSCFVLERGPVTSRLHWSLPAAAVGPGAAATV